MSEKDEWQRLVETRKIAEYWIARCSRAEKQLEQRNWISVKDRLPEPNTVVLAHYDDGIICTIAYLDEYLKFMSSGNVTHWMPLPEPPDERSDAE